MQRHVFARWISWVGAVLLGLASSTASANERSWLEVRVTAYNASVAQTDDDPWVAAWGDRLRPGMRAIAVSRDLLALGLGHGTHVEIEGLPGHYVVLDKTHRRWTRRVDLFMGKDIQKARNWGIRKMRIRRIVPGAARLATLLGTKDASMVLAGDPIRAQMGVLEWTSRWHFPRTHAAPLLAAGDS